MAASGLRADLILDPMALEKSATSLSSTEKDLNKSLTRLRDALILKTPEERIKNLERAERAFLEWNLSQAKLLWKEVFEENEKSFPSTQQLDVDRRLQELAWLLWVAENQESEIPDSAWRYVSENNFLEKLPSGAKQKIRERSLSRDSGGSNDSGSPKAVLRAENLPLNSSGAQIFVNFQKVQLPHPLPAGTSHLEILIDDKIHLYHVSSLQFEELASYSLWQSPNLNQNSSVLRKLASGLSAGSNEAVYVLRKNLQNEKEKILIKSATRITAPPPVMTQTSASLQPEDLNREIAALFEDSPVIEEPTFPILKNPWFWIGVGVIAGSATALTLHLNQRTVVTSP
jgi:hypothetical protein